MPNFHDRRTGEVSQLPSERAHYLTSTWRHGHPETRAVVWTSPNKGQKQGSRYEGSHVSPAKGGFHLHGGPKAQFFSDKSEAKITYVNPKGSAING